MLAASASRAVARRGRIEQAVAAALVRAVARVGDGNSGSTGQAPPETAGGPPPVAT